MKKQLVYIHGGDPYDTYGEFIADLKRSKLEADDFKQSTEKRWKDALQAELGPEYEIFRPEMPNWMNARYIEWEIFFGKMLKYVRPGAVFIGHSLGAIFLARYSADNPNHGAAGIILIAPPFRAEGGFAVPKDAQRLAKLGARLHVYFSADDPIVPFSNMKKYTKVVSDAVFTEFVDKGHFYAQKEFPEIIRDIRAL